MCGGSNKQTSTSTYRPDPQAKEFYSDVLTDARSAITPYDPATEKSIASLTPQQLAAFGGVDAMQGAYQPYLDQATGMTQAGGAGITADDIAKFMNPFQDQALAQTLRTLGEQNAMQTRDYTANQAAQSGLGGSGYFLGKADLAGNQAQSRDATIANMLMQGWQSSLGAAQADKTRGLQAGQQMAGLGQLGSQLGYQDVQALTQAGGQQQAQTQAEYDAASQNALNRQLYPMQQQQWLASIGSGIGPLMGGTTKGTAKAEQGKGVGNVIGGALTLAGMASDERVKENAIQIGETFDGQPIYKFNYRGDPRSQIGLMAQDVEQGEHPEAVRELGGVKHVNYDEALSDAGGYANGGGIGFSGGLLPWAEIRPATPIVPQLPEMKGSGEEGGGSQDWEQMYNMGKKAGAGLGQLFGGSGMPSASSPAGGALAASGLQGYGGSGGGGGLGSLFSGLGGLFGFADGGLVASPEEMYALEQVESGGRDIVNPKSGAFGPRQIMPATARDPGFGVRPLDPAGDLDDQRRFSDDYFNAMLKRYSGDREAARIAYNGGPARADAWIKAGRDDSVIPRESADYYKKVAGRMGAASATDGGGTSGLVQKGMTATRAEGEPYVSKTDKATGGFLKSMFGVDFNPLGLTENERKSLIVAGLSMMSHGNIGKGGLAGMQYLTGVEAGERDARTEAAKLSAQLRKDAAELALKTRALDQADTKEAREARFAERSANVAERGATTAEKKAASEAGQFERTFGLDLNKFNQSTASDAAKLAWDREKQFLESGKPSDDLKEYGSYASQEIAAGRTPTGFLDYQLQLKAAGRAETNVNVSGDKKGMEEMGKLHAKKYDAIQANADGAQTMIDNLDTLERSLGTGVRTGALAETEQTLRKFGAALGIGDINKVAGGELIQAITNKLALQMRAPGGESGGLPGATSDADREFLKEAVAGLGKTPEGNRQIIAIMRAAAERHIAISNMAIDYAAENGQLDPKFDKLVREYVKENPLSGVVKKAAPAAAPARAYTPKPGVPRWGDPNYEPGMTMPPAGAPASGGGFKILRVQ